MNSVEQIANAVLYEGYVLYPYRNSALKNRQRWNFGILFSPQYSGVKNGSDACVMQTECLLEGSAQTSLDVRIRFLQHGSETTVEREVCITDLIHEKTNVHPFSFPGLEGAAEISAQLLAPDLFKLTLRIENKTLFCGENRDEALQHSLISTHSLLSLKHGKFHSLIDPPPEAQPFAGLCKNIGAWPVLAGEEGSRDQMLSAPIILYDYPKVSPQSPGDFFDGTEIDEMLSLRILTLTDAEKCEMRQAETRTRQLLERTENFREDEMLALHGVAHFKKSEVPFKTGDRVRLQPKGRADAFDFLLKGKSATVLSVEQTFENEFFISVTIDDDPGKDFGSEGKIGHRFFFRPDEVERL